MCAPFATAAPDEPLLELAPQALKKRNRNKQIKTEKCKNCKKGKSVTCIKPHGTYMGMTCIEPYNIYMYDFYYIYIYMTGIEPL